MIEDSAIPVKRRSLESLISNRVLFSDTPPLLDRRRAGEPVPLLVAFGGGLNSSAGLILLHAWGDRPDAILFADTGGEKHATYDFVGRMNEWCLSVGFPEITTVKRTLDYDKQKHEEKYNTLEEECLVKKTLPSIAFYGRSCSEKWKQQPQNKWANNDPHCQSWWGKDEKVVKAIFYDASEPERASSQQDAKYVYWHPLLETNWARDECRAALELAGLPIPPKSSCFFCSEMTPSEIRALPDDLKERALRIESNANLTSVKGLGKHEYSWRELLDDRVPLAVVSRCEGTVKMPCMCYDGAGLEDKS